MGVHILAAMLQACCMSAENSTSIHLQDKSAEECKSWQ